MAEAPARCKNCGAPLDVANTKCRFCGEVVPGRASAGQQLPPEVTSAAERLRTGLKTPDALIDHLVEASQRILPRSAVRVSKARGRAPQLQVQVGTIAYGFRQEGAGIVVDRQSVAGGFAVGMKDVLPASRWPEQFVIDVANNADETGQDWKAAVGAL